MTRTRKVILCLALAPWLILAILAALKHEDLLAALGVGVVYLWAAVGFVYVLALAIELGTRPPER